jgi:ribokinase
MFGKKAINGFKDDSIDVKYVYKDKTAASGIALIMVGENGQNSISVALGANLCLSPADIQKASRLITSAKILVLQLEIPLESVQAAIEIAHKNGVRVILNPAPAQPLDHELLCKVSILTPNESEAEILTGIATNDEPSMNAVADKLMTFGIETVLLTLGARGVFCATKTERTLIPAFTVEPVDTTAAGDVFNGALAVALAKKKSLTESVRFANAAAAISVTRLGAQPSAPYKKEIDKFLKERS